MKKKIDFKSESGAALVLEATIVYPIVLVAVMFLILWGLTYAQQGYMQYLSSSLSSYLVKSITYPGYDKLEAPFYTTNTKSQLASVNEAMEVHNPYRYLLGMDSEVDDIVEATKTQMVDNYLPDSGFLKAAKGQNVRVPDELRGMDYQSSSKNGYTCAICAKNGFARVYIAQNYVFADFTRMIGLGGKTMVISGDSLQYMSDSVEIVRLTDFAYDSVNLLLEHFGSSFNLDQIRATIDKMMGKS
ncbi:MAG: hypothetical protein ACI4Q4_08005 [Oscillospiraceae bacterium]